MICSAPRVQEENTIRKASRMDGSGFNLQKQKFTTNSSGGDLSLRHGKKRTKRPEWSFAHREFRHFLLSSKCLISSSSLKKNKPSSS